MLQATDLKMCRMEMHSASHCTWQVTTAVSPWTSSCSMDMYLQNAEVREAQHTWGSS